MSEMNWKFNLDADTKEAIDFAKSLGTVENQLKETDAVLGKLNQHLKMLKAPGEMRRLRRDIADLEHPPGLVAKAFRSMGSAISLQNVALAGIGLGAAAAVGGVYLLTTGLISLASAALTAAGEQQELERTFKALAGPEKGMALLGWFGDLAKVTKYGDEQIAAFAQRLEMAGIQGESLGPALAGALDMGVMGKLVGGADAAVAKLAQISQTGVLADKSLLAFGVNEEQVFATLIKNTGKREKALRKLMGEGKLDKQMIITTVLQTVQQKTNQPLGSLAIEQGQGFEARVARLKRAPGEILESFSKTKAFEQVSDLLGKLAAAFDPEGPAGKKLVAGLERLSAVIANAFKDVKAEDVINGIVKVIDLIGKAANVAAIAIKVLAAAMGEVKLSGDFQGGKLEKALNVTKSGIGGAIVDGITGGMYSKLGLAKKAIGGLTDMVIGTTEDNLKIQSPSKVFENIGSLTGAGFVRGVERSSPSVESAVMQTFSARAMAPSPAVQAFSPRMIPAPSAFGSGNARARESSSNVTISFDNMVINAGAGTDGQQIAGHVRESVSAQMMTFLERMSLSAGAA